MVLASCFQNCVLISSVCLLCGAYAATMWRGDSVVLNVAVRSLPEIGLSEVIVGVLLGSFQNILWQPFLDLF